jgi:hypothetical protein
LADYKAKRVERETSIPGIPGGEKNFRTDLLIYLTDETKHIHIEVKLDDSNFEKTCPTSKSLNLYLKDNNTKHFILVPEYRKQECLDEFSAKNGDYPKINVIIWNDVADSLRNTLFNEETNNLDNKYTEWNVWASSFLGCIEQKLLGFEYIPENKVEQEQKKYSIYSLMKNLTARGNKMTTMDDIFFQKGLGKYFEIKSVAEQWKKILDENISNVISEIFREKKIEYEKPKKEVKGWFSDNSKVYYFCEELLIQRMSEKIGFQYGISWYRNNKHGDYAFMIYVVTYGIYNEKLKPFAGKIEFRGKTIFVETYPGDSNGALHLIKKFKEENDAVNLKEEFNDLISQFDEIVFAK